MGFKDMARMNEEELQRFQRRFVQQKTDHEAGCDHFITEHSFVDCATYWVVRDQQSNDVSSTEDELTARCRQLSRQYTIHIVLPFGGIPFREDGYRSTDLKLHRRVADQIETFLKSWHLPHVILRKSDLHGRVREVIAALERIQQTEPGIEAGGSSTA